MAPKKIDASSGEGAISLADSFDHITDVLLNHHGWTSRKVKGGRSKLSPPESRQALDEEQVRKYLQEHFVLSETASNHAAATKTTTTTVSNQRGNMALKSIQNNPSDVTEVGKRSSSSPSVTLQPNKKPRGSAGTKGDTSKARQPVVHGDDGTGFMSSSSARYKTPLPITAEASQGKGKRRRVSAVDTDSKKIKRGETKISHQHKQALAVLQRKGWSLDSNQDAFMLSPGAGVAAPHDLPASFESKVEAMEYAVGLVTQDEMEAVNDKDAELAAMDPWERAEAKLLETRAMLDGERPADAYVPVREGQMKKLVNFLSYHVEHVKGGFMHLSGMPGTGKTLCSHRAVSLVQAFLEEKKDKVPNVIRINCTHHQEDPSSLFQAIYEETNAAQKGKKESVSAAVAEDRLATRFAPVFNRNKGMTILILDEMDRLHFDRETGGKVLRSLLGIALNDSTLVVIGISNTLDQRWQSLLPPEHQTSDPNKYGIDFPSYDKDEITKIIKARVEDRFHVSSCVCWYVGSICTTDWMNLLSAVSHIDSLLL